MKETQIKSLTEEETDEELFREMSCSWDKKTLINHIIGNMSLEDKKIWIKEYFDY